MLLAITNIWMFPLASGTCLTPFRSSYNLQTENSAGNSVVHSRIGSPGGGACKKSCMASDWQGQSLFRCRGTPLARYKPSIPPISLPYSRAPPLLTSCSQLKGFLARHHGMLFATATSPSADTGPTGGRTFTRCRLGCNPPLSIPCAGRAGPPVVHTGHISLAQLGRHQAYWHSPDSRWWIRRYFGGYTSWP